MGEHPGQAIAILSSLNVAPECFALQGAGTLPGLVPPQTFCKAGLGGDTWPNPPVSSPQSPPSPRLVPDQPPLSHDASRQPPLLRLHALTDPASELFKVGALLSTTSNLGSLSIFTFRCFFIFLNLHFYLNLFSRPKLPSTPLPIDTSALSLSLLMKALMLSIMPCVASVPLLLLLPLHRKAGCYR